MLLTLVFMAAVGAVGFGIGRIYERVDAAQKRYEREQRRQRRLNDVRRKADYMATVSYKAPGEVR